jgi:hypothetical protein
LFYVVSGRVGFLVNDKWHEVGPGGTAFMPRGLVHTFKNVCDQPSCMLVMTMPSGIEKFFARCAEELRNPAGRLRWRSFSRSARSTEFISCWNKTRKAAVNASGYSNFASRLI